MSQTAESDKGEAKDRLLGGLFLGTVSLVSALGGFSFALGQARKSDPKGFNVHADAVSLATRALGRGSLYAVLGVGGLTLIVAKALGVSSPKEFRHAMESGLSGLPNVERGSGRTEFASFRELFTWLAEGGADGPRPSSS